jgi:hypothetical protein
MGTGGPLVEVEELWGTLLEEVEEVVKVEVELEVVVVLDCVEVVEVLV